MDNLEATHGTHLSDPFTVPCQLDAEGNLVGTYYAVLSSKEDTQTAKDLNRDWQQRLAMQDIETQTKLTVDLAAPDDLFQGTNEETEEDPGAFVHFNVDNDNDNTNDGTPTGTPIADYTEEGPIQGEDDIIAASLTISPSEWMQFAKIKLRRSGPGLRVWTNGIKGPDEKLLVDVDEKVWDLSDPAQRAEFMDIQYQLCVEGYSLGEFLLSASLLDAAGADLVEDKVKYTFIAATCGRQPTPHERNHPEEGLETAFPNLVPCEWSITAPPHDLYNCIAWSVGENGIWYDKISSGVTDWGAPKIGIDEAYGNDNGIFELDHDLDAFYSDKGYDLLTGQQANPRNADAMYYQNYHAAAKKGCPCGAGHEQWIMYDSKCGRSYRLEHLDDQLNGAIYGTPIRFYKRR